MSFSSLNEAYSNSVIRGITPESVYKRPDVFEQTSSQELMYLLNPNTPSIPTKTYSIESFSNTHEEAPKQQDSRDSRDSHTMFMEHLNSCSRCRHRFSPKIGKYNLDERVLNTLIYIISMIFILFLLDIFVRLGAVLSRK